MSSLGKPARALELFYSYSQKDERYFKELEVHLSVLKQQGYISGWHACNITAGTEWRSKTLAHLVMADIILLLVSSDFLASEYYQSKELKQAIEERHWTGKARIVPIIVRECAWEETIIEKLYALPTSHKPVVNWKSRDKAWLQITQGIRQVVEELLASSPSTFSLPNPDQQEKTDAPSLLRTEKQRMLDQQIEQERHRQNNHIHIGQRPMKIDKDIIIRYDLDMQMSEFSRRLNFGGAYPFLLGGQDNVLRDYIVERMCRELKTKLGRPHRRIDIRLVREDITDVQHVLRKKVLGKEYHTLVDLFKEEPTKDIVLTIWNYFFPPEMLRIAAHYFWEDIVTTTLPFLKYETGQCFIIILANVGEKEFINQLDHFTLIHVPEHFEMPRFTDWISGWLRGQGIKQADIDTCIHRLQANHGHFLATYQEMENILGDLQGRYPGQ